MYLYIYIFVYIYICIYTYSYTPTYFKDRNIQIAVTVHDQGGQLLGAGRVVSPSSHWGANENHRKTIGKWWFTGIYIDIDIWLVVWNMTFIFPYIGLFIIPIDELIFFREVGIPPTRSNMDHMGMGWSWISVVVGNWWWSVFLAIGHDLCIVERNNVS